MILLSLPLLPPIISLFVKSCLYKLILCNKLRNVTLSLEKSKVWARIQRFNDQEELQNRRSPPEVEFGRVGDSPCLKPNRTTSAARGNNNKRLRQSDFFIRCLHFEWVRGLRWRHIIIFLCYKFNHELVSHSSGHRPPPESPSLAYIIYIVIHVKLSIKALLLNISLCIEIP